MPLGTKVGLGRGHIVLHGDPALPKRGTAPIFRPMSTVAKRSPISATAEPLFLNSASDFVFSFVCFAASVFSFPILQIFADISL